MNQKEINEQCQAWLKAYKPNYLDNCWASMTKSEKIIALGFTNITPQEQNRLLDENMLGIEQRNTQAQIMRGIKKMLKLRREED